MPLHLPRTRAALAAYDATYEARAIEHNADLAAWAVADKAAADVVREAFAADTADRNRREQAMRVQMGWIREWVAMASDRPAAAEPVTLSLPF